MPPAPTPKKQRVAAAQVATRPATGLSSQPYGDMAPVGWHPAQESTAKWSVPLKRGSLQQVDVGMGEALVVELLHMCRRASEARRSLDV